MVKSITYKLHYYLSIGNSLEVRMYLYLLKLQMHKHGYSIYFMRDNMVYFSKSGHIYGYVIEGNAKLCDLHHVVTCFFYYLCKYGLSMPFPTKVIKHRSEAGEILAWTVTLVRDK